MTSLWLPMLADSTEPRQLDRYIDDNNWWMNQKLDGDRLLIYVENGVVNALNRKGREKTRGVNHRLLAPFEEFNAGRFVFDGELLGDGMLHIFDVPFATSLGVERNTPLDERTKVLDMIFDLWHPTGIVKVATARTAAEKALMVKIAMESQLEGVMIKRANGLYVNKRSSSWLKAKFVKDADFIVTAIGQEGKTNAVLGLIDPDRGTVVEVGRASAIGKANPQPGEVWTVRYLYCVDPRNPRLYQPRLMHRRTDKQLSECTIDQLDGSYTDRNYIITKSREEEV